jgi:hypothetical protein
MPILNGEGTPDEGTFARIPNPNASADTAANSLTPMKYFGDNVTLRNMVSIHFI